VVAVLCQVGQVAEIGKGADHAHRLVARQGLEQLLERAVGLLVRIAAEGDRELAHLLHQLIGGHALLVPDHVPQNAAEQADVVNQGLVLVGSFHARVSGMGGGGPQAYPENHQCGRMLASPAPE